MHVTTRTTAQQIDAWNWSVRKVNADETHGVEIGRIRRQGNARGVEIFAAWVKAGTMFLGEFATRDDARAAINRAAMNLARGVHEIQVEMDAMEDAARSRGMDL